MEELFFSDKFGGSHLEELSKQLTPEILEASARNHRDGKKRITIELSGIAGTTLLTRNNSPELEKIHEQFVALLKAIPSLKEKGIDVRIRILFSYLYSDFAYAQIEAEKNRYRSTLKKKYEGVDLYILDKHDFEKSDTSRSQEQSLQIIEDLYNDNCIANFKFEEVFDIRFSCLPLNFRIVNINDAIFFNTYSYAKENEDSRMNHDMPLVGISPSGNDGNEEPSRALKIVEVIKNHFWYIWHHSTTLLYTDATEWKIQGGKLTELRRVKEPKEITFANKKERVRKKYPEVDEKQLQKMEFQTKNNFRHMVREIPIMTLQETIFIGFAHTNGGSIARTVETYLMEDFREYLKINIVRVEDSDVSLYPTLIKQMNEATMGLLFLTGDLVEDISTSSAKDYYCKPNVYFEYGYLLNHLKKYHEQPSGKRLLVFRDKKVHYASDTKDITEYEEDINNDICIYQKIIERIIKYIQTLSPTDAKEVITRYCERLDAKRVSVDLLQKLAVSQDKDPVNLLKSIETKLLNIFSDRTK